MRLLKNRKGRFWKGKVTFQKSRPIRPPFNLNFRLNIFLHFSKLSSCPNVSPSAQWRARCRARCSSASQLKVPQFIKIILIKCQFWRETWMTTRWEDGLLGNKNCGLSTCMLKPSYLTVKVRTVRNKHCLRHARSPKQILQSRPA